MTNSTGEGPGGGTDRPDPGPLTGYLPHPYQSLDRDGEILAVNEAWLSVLGYDREDVVGRWFGTFLAGDAVDRFTEEFREFIETGAVSDAEYEIRRADGDVIVVSFDGRIEYDEDGAMVRSHCQFTDVTERVARERDLQRYERLTNSMLEAACVYDEEGRFETVNAFLADWYGTDPAELEGTTSNLIPLIRERYDGDPYQELLDGDRAELTGRVEAEFTGHGRAVLDYRLTPLVVDGTIEGVVGVTRDVTVRAERERELRRAREEYQELFNGMNDTAWVLDPSGEILAVNDAAVERLGYSRAELTDMSPHDIDTRLDDGEITDLIERMPDDEVQVFETTHRTKDGREIPVEISSSLITYRDQVAILSIARDITERRERERELQEHEHRYESLFESIRDAILVTDDERRIRNANPAFEELFGYDVADVEGEPTAIIYESDAAFASMGAEIERHHDEPEFTRTVTYEKRSGQTFTGETTVSYLRDANDEVIGFIGVIRDITERRQRLRQLQMVDRILQHNFNNNMNVVEGHAENIRDATSGDLAAAAETILASSQRLRRTVEKERDVTKFLSSQTRVLSQDVVPTIESLVADLRARHPEASISTALPSEATVRAVPEITLAIEEVLENAVLHADADGPRVRVTVDGDDDALEIRVRDSNPQIPEMERSVLLEGEEVAPLYHGSGIGLWLVNLIVTHSDGVVDVETTAPRGNAVTIRLPRDG